MDRLVDEATRCGLAVHRQQQPFSDLALGPRSAPGQPYSCANCPAHRCRLAKALPPRHSPAGNLRATGPIPGHLLPGGQLDSGGSNYRPDASESAPAGQLGSCSPQVQYGKNFRALLAYLYDAQVGASRRIRQMGQEMFGFALSEGTLQKARQEQYDALAPFENRLVEILPQEALLHADETSVPINKVNHWLHVLCTPLLTFFSVQPNRSKEAIQAIGIIPRFVGWLMHDFLSSYASFENCLHTFCKGHLLRELVFLFEQHQQSWAKDLYDLFLEMLKCVKDRKARDAPLTPAEVDRWYQQYRKILRAGRQANPLTPEQMKKKRPKQSKEQNLLDRLDGCDECILAFLWNFTLPFTNNQAERDFRMVKVRVKVSGCFRTLEGARCHARIRSYISTLRKHGLPVLEYLRHALDGRPFLPVGSKMA